MVVTGVSAVEHGKTNDVGLPATLVTRPQSLPHLQTRRSGMSHHLQDHIPLLVVHMLRCSHLLDTGNLRDLGAPRSHSELY